MLVVITKIICDECNGADISTSSHVEQKEMVILAARESGWKTRETRRRKHPQWICPNCSKGAVQNTGKDEEESE